MKDNAILKEHIAQATKAAAGKDCQGDASWHCLHCFMRTYYAHTVFSNEGFSNSNEGCFKRREFCGKHLLRKIQLSKLEDILK